jgi:hypothetical protein
VGCATEQIVPVSIEPAPVEVYVDGRLAASGAPDRLVLRSDRGHVVLIRRQGYRSEQVVLQSVDRDGERRLEPGRIVVQLAPEQGRGRRIEVELDPRDAQEDGAGAPAPEAGRDGAGDAAEGPDTQGHEEEEGGRR